MKNPHLFLTIRLILILGSVLLLSSCIPTPGNAPSGALKEQLYKIKQQQQEQAAQIQQLRQQFAGLQRQLITEDGISAQLQSTLKTPNQLEVPTVPAIIAPVFPGQFTVKQEVTNLAASASSYLAAFSNFAAGRLFSAEVGFQKFLDDFPNHQYSSNARYWLANAQLSQGKTEPAIANLRRIIDNPNAQTKAPAALMQLTQLYRQQGLPIQADDVLEQLRSRYPESPEAQHFYRSDKPIN